MFTIPVVVAVVITGFAVLLLPFRAPCSWGGWVVGRSQGSEPSCIPLCIPYMSPHPIHALWKAAWLSEWGAFLLHPIRATLMMAEWGEGGGYTYFFCFAQSSALQMEPET